MIIKETQLWTKVWRDGNYTYKRQPKHLADNEWYALGLLRNTGMVPSNALRIDDKTIRMDTVINEEVTDPVNFWDYCWLFLKLMKGQQIRHGDLTKPHVFVVENSPVVIDWGESRLWSDPRPDKRREGDRHWMEATCRKILRVQPEGDAYVGSCEHILQPW